MTTKNSPLRVNEISRIARTTLGSHHHGVGLWVLIATLFLLSLLAGIQSPTQIRVFMAGEIADSDVIAHRDLTVEDPQAAQARRAQVAMLQPTIFDLSVTEIATLREQVFKLLRKLNTFDVTTSTDTLRIELGELLGDPVNSDMITLWQQPDVQEYILATALPWLENRLREGVVSDARLALPSKNGIIIRDMDTTTETLRPEVGDILDIQALLAAFSQQLRAEQNLSLQKRRAIQSLFSPLLMPTLTLNREATLARGKAVAQTVEPVYYNIQKGEIVVYQGERITKEKQLKLQSLYQKKEGLVHARLVAGTFLLSLLLTVGLFMAPSGRPGTPLRRKDFYFISLLLLGFGLTTKGAYILTGKLVQAQDIALAVYFVPIAGASGLCALIFAARRYCTVGLLLSLFACAMLKGGLPLFLFFFLSAMLNTWLVIRAQNRQDVVMSIIPLFIGMTIIALGSGWLEGLRGGNGFLFLLGGITINALFSIAILFAISPIIEMAFGYTTRFRLMELMNLEQPLLQDLMVSIPGTYHHSLVVSNMVEAGAKAVGANSLLCKVAALYHDIGKLAYPEYYIENQFSGPNRHDKLAPAMSALILLSHVKKGSELAAQHHLGDEIGDVLRQHHGTGLIRYFYNKAKENGENPNMEDYCYPGPRPQSREAAIVMLADIVEASSRTLTDPTPARIKTHIDTIMKGIFSDGQLDESELTFKDLHKLSENFARILTGLFHQRIVYPEMARKPGNEPAVKPKPGEKTLPVATPAPPPVPGVPSVPATPAGIPAAPSPVGAQLSGVMAGTPVEMDVLATLPSSMPSPTPKVLPVQPSLPAQPPLPAQPSATEKPAVITPSSTPSSTPQQAGQPKQTPSATSGKPGTGQS